MAVSPLEMPNVSDFCNLCVACRLLYVTLITASRARVRQTLSQFGLASCAASQLAEAGQPASSSGCPLFFWQLFVESEIASTFGKP